jgi:hypothetical protein
MAARKLPELTLSETRCLAAIIRLKKENGGDSPTLLEIGGAIGVTEGHAGALVQSLRGKKRLAPSENKRRFLKVLRNK